MLVFNDGMYVNRFFSADLLVDLLVLFFFIPFISFHFGKMDIFSVAVAVVADCFKSVVRCVLMCVSKCAILHILPHSKRV